MTPNDFYNMKRIVQYVTILLLITTSLQAQFNVELLSQRSFEQTLNDVWGYVDSTGREYALVGTGTGTSIFDLSDPTNPEEVYTIVGGNSFWRDIKVYDKYAYVVDDVAGEGLVIIDMTNAPNEFEHTYFTDLGEEELSSCHNLFIDEAQGIAYLFGCSGNNGVIILDLKNDPMSPELLGIYDMNYVHDGFIRNDTMWAAEAFAGQVGIIDVTDKANPVVMATRSTPGGLTHNCWVSDDGNMLYTTDEISGGFISAYNISDLNNIYETDRIRSNPGSGVAPHNVFVYGDYLVTSYYTDGIVIYDATNPSILVEVGNYDTSPDLEGWGFIGCWGVYPYLPSGIILATDIEEGFFVLQPNYQQACYAKVTVKDAETNAPLGNTIVSITGTDNSEATLFDGTAKFGIVTAGVYNLDIERAGYIGNTAEIVLENGQTTEITVLLEPNATFACNFTVVDASGNPIPNAQASFKYSLDNLTGTANNEGIITIDDFFNSTFEVSIGAWGYLPYQVSALELGEANNGQVFTLSEKGYYDDFSLDLGWNVSGDATTGIWERDKPIGTYYGGELYNPESDVANDFGNECFITGNGGGSANSDDVESGITILTSPVFDLSEYQAPFLSFNCWFASNVGDKILTARLSNGIDSVDFFDVNENSPMSQWLITNFRVIDHITPTENMTISFIIEDFYFQHLVEAAIDVFKVVDAESQIVGEVKNEEGATLEDIMIEISNNEIEPFSMTTNNTGNFSTSLPIGQYTIIAGQWGYITQALEITINEDGIIPLDITLEQGYYDDFLFDFGWSVTGNAANGLWERGIPEGTFSSSLDKYYNPNSDLNDDLGENCYVTGLAADGGLYNNDVDSGSITLKSPFFDLSNYENPYINFSQWFANGPDGADDKFYLTLLNGEESYIFNPTEATDSNNHSWQWKTIRVLDYIEPTADMQIHFTAWDQNEEHIVEAGLDGFSITDSTNNTGLSNILNSDTNYWDVQVHPNPFKNILILELKEAEELLNQNEAVEVVLYDLLGKTVTTQIFEEEKIILETSDLSSGIYFYSIQTKGQILQTGRVIKK